MKSRDMTKTGTGPLKKTTTTINIYLIKLIKYYYRYCRNIERNMAVHLITMVNNIYFEIELKNYKLNLNALIFDFLQV